MDEEGRLFLDRIKDGDPAAMEDFYLLHQERAFRHAQATVRSRALAEEACQEAFLQFWSQADQIKSDHSAGVGFLLALVHRRAVDSVRREERLRALSRRFTQSDVPDVAELVVASDGWATVRSAVDQLEDPHRRAIGLAFFRGQTYRRVAEIMGVPEGTAKSWIREGLTRLRARLDEG